MKAIQSLIPRIATLIFHMASIIAGLIFLILITSILFNFNPILNIKNKHLGISGYDKGFIPASFSSYKSLTDMSIKRKTDSDSFIDYKSYTTTTTTQLNIPVIQSDTITTVYKDMSRNNFQVSGLIIEKGKILIKPTSMKQKLILSTPLLLILLMIFYGSRQIAIFLNNISKGNSFNLTNFQRLNKAGFAVIASYLFLFIYDAVINSTSKITVFLESSLKDFWSPFEYNFRIDSKMDVIWLMVGVFFIILASAFKSGYKLQQEQDLTV